MALSLATADMACRLPTASDVFAIPHAETFGLTRKRDSALSDFAGLLSAYIKPVKIRLRSAIVRGRDCAVELSAARVVDAGWPPDRPQVLCRGCYPA